MRETVLVTEQEFAKAGDAMRTAAGITWEPVAADEAALAAAVTARGVRAVIVGVATYGGPLYEALAGNGGGLIARFGVGYDGLNTALARQHGIIITNTPGVLDISVAEHTVWLLGCLARSVSRSETRLRAGEFSAPSGMELYGKTLGILGFGNIGRRVAAIARFGLGMNVIACDQLPPEQVAGLLAAACASHYTTDVEELFCAVDVLSVHLPSIASTQKFINAERLAWLQRGTLLINTARGAVLDEAALFDALVAGQLAGAALDVFSVEPYQPACPEKDLRRLDNVVLTPHIGSNTREANARMAARALENVRNYFAGRLELLNRVDSRAV